MCRCLARRLERTGDTSPGQEVAPPAVLPPDGAFCGLLTVGDIVLDLIRGLQETERFLFWSGCGSGGCSEQANEMIKGVKNLRLFCFGIRPWIYTLLRFVGVFPVVFYGIRRVL